MLLNVNFFDPPYVKRVDGEIGGVPFRWELSKWRMDFDITTQDKQESKIVTAWQRQNLFAGLTNRRLLAALHYFHVAVRLARSGVTPGEFMEVILNLGYGDLNIERLFMPAMALRNESDVRHVELALFTQSQLTLIHAYTEEAETAFRKLLERVLVATGDQLLG